MEQFQGSCDSLQELPLRPFRFLIVRPGHPTHLGHGRETIVQLSDVAVGFPGIAPGPVQGETSSTRRVFSWNIHLIIGPWRSLDDNTWRGWLRRRTFHFLR